jgi:hypothetical protein
MNASIDRRPSLPRFVTCIQKKGRTYYYFRRRPFPCIRLPEEPASPLFTTAYNAALQASTREEFIALRAGMQTRKPDNPAARALIARAEAMLLAGRFGVAAEKEATKPRRPLQSEPEAKGRWHPAKVRQEKPVTLTQREAAEIVALVEELARVKKHLEQLEGDGDKANEVLARYARHARAKGIEIQYTATLSDLLWTYTATINRACRVRMSVARFGAR